MRVAVDTNRYVDLCKGVAETVTLLEEAETVLLPFVVIGELRAGFAHGRRQAENERVLRRFLSKDGVRALFAERRDGVFTLRRGFAIAPGERIAVVEDVFTTGGSTREVCETVAGAGGRVVAVGSVVDRGAPERAFSVPARSVLSLSVPSWPAEECPLCVRGVALDAPGSRSAPG